MAITLVDFEDIYTAILEMLKIQASDTTTLARIKRDINIAYEDVIARKNWWWNRSLTTTQLPAKITTGTVSATNNSTSITFSSAPAASVANYRIKLSGSPEVYTIASHTAASTSATLSAAFVGTTVGGSSYKVWKDFAQLPTDCRETFIVQHQLYAQPMEALGLEDFRRVVAQQPDKEGAPLFYCTDDQDSSGKRRLRYWPAVYTNKVNLDIDYLMTFTALDLDGDEPAMPVHDRTVLFYYACAHAWRRERNTEEANNYFQLGEKKLDEMASKMEDSKGMPVLRPGVGYMAQKRQQRRNRNRWD
jgi:hypothetical protein